MRMSHTPEKQDLLHADFVAWRLMNCKERQHRQEVEKLFNQRPRLRREVKH